jgi:hypothetical protein
MGHLEYKAGELTISLSRMALGHTIAQVVTCFKIVAAQVPSQFTSRRIPGGENGNGTDSLWVLWFHLSTLIPPTAPYSLIILSVMPFILTVSLNNI